MKRYPALPDTCESCVYCTQHTMELGTPTFLGPTRPTRSWVCELKGQDKQGRWAHIEREEKPPKGCPLRTLPPLEEAPILNVAPNDQQISPGIPLYQVDILTAIRDHLSRHRTEDWTEVDPDILDFIRKQQAPQPTPLLPPQHPQPGPALDVPFPRPFPYARTLRELYQDAIGLYQGVQRKSVAQRMDTLTPVMVDYLREYKEAHGVELSTHEGECPLDQLIASVLDSILYLLKWQYEIPNWPEFYDQRPFKDYATQMLALIEWAEMLRTQRQKIQSRREEAKKAKEGTGTGC